MQRDFQLIRDTVPIEAAARHLMGDPIKKMYRYPGEKTASIKLYPGTRSFHDFGRNVGGDCIRLWSHVRQVDSGQAIQEICEEFGITLDRPDRTKIAESIRKQEQERKQREEEKKRQRKMWLLAVERVKFELQAVENILETAAPLSNEWCFCIDRKQRVEYLLDYLCGILD